jgi:hypothetical protein
MSSVGAAKLVRPDAGQRRREAKVSRGSTWPTLAGIAIGLGVPVVAFGCALAFSIQVDEPAWGGFSKTHMAWTAAAVVGLAGVICGTVLAAASLQHELASAVNPHAKPPAEDYTEGVGRRF